MCDQPEIPLSFEDVHFLIFGSCEYVTLYGKGDLVDVITFFEMVRFFLAYPDGPI